MTRQLTSVLLVDDYEPDVVYGRLMLEASKRCGQVLVARNPREALQMFEDFETQRQVGLGGFPPLVVMLDINMPEMSGFEFLERFQQIHEGDPPSAVVLLSSSKTPEEKARADAYDSVAGYLTKPLDIAQVHWLANTFGVEPDGGAE